MPDRSDSRHATEKGTVELRDRVLSLDQFRGYTILGMILVNFIGYFDEMHAVFKHNDNYFSYADCIMTAFHLAVGFSFRLTMLRRLASATANLLLIWWSYLKRSLTLVFIGTLFFGIGGGSGRWQQFSEMLETKTVSQGEHPNESNADTEVRLGPGHALLTYPTLLYQPPMSAHSCRVSVVPEWDSVDKIDRTTPS